MKKLLTIDDITILLGLSKSRVYRLVRNRKIPFIRISGKVIRFRENEIEQWLLSKSHSPRNGHCTGAAGTLTNVQHGRLSNNHINRIIDSTRKTILKEAKNV